MRFVKFIYTERLGYLQESSSDYAYGMLGDFFTEEVDCGAEEFKPWLFEHTLLYLCGNITMIDKNDDGSLRLHYIPPLELTDESIEEIKHESGVKHVEEEIVMSREDFVHILDGWGQCRKHWFDEIWVKNDNGVFWVEGVT